MDEKLMPGGEADEDGLQNCGDWWFCSMVLDRRHEVCERGG